MPMITEEMMQRRAMLADYHAIKKLTMKIVARLNRASEVEVTSPAGTELRLGIKGEERTPTQASFMNLAISATCPLAKPSSRHWRELLKG